MGIKSCIFIWRLLFLFLHQYSYSTIHKRQQAYKCTIFPRSSTMDSTARRQSSTLSIPVVQLLINSKYTLQMYFFLRSSTMDSTARRQRSTLSIPVVQLLINSNYTSVLFPQEQYNGQYGKEAEIYHQYSCLICNSQIRNAQVGTSWTDFCIFRHNFCRISFIFWLAIP